MDALTRMQAFIQVVDAGGFSAAARRMGKSKALISKYVKELEDELGVRLLNRTTRQLSLTEVGQVYHRDVTEILQRISDLSANVSDIHRDPKGLLRISGPRTFSDGMLGDGIMAFLDANPLISIDLRCEDRFVDLVEEGFDVAIRISELGDSSMIARRLASFRIITWMTPDLIARIGEPSTPADLAERPCVIDTNFRGRSSWPFQVDGQRQAVSVKGRVEVNSPAAVRLAGLRGLGIARTPYFLVRRDIEEGRIQPILEAYEPPALGIFAVYPHRRHLSGKVRAFVDFMAGWFDDRRAAGETC